MPTNFDACLVSVLREEGDVSDNKLDPGGLTRKGVTQRVYDAYRRSKGLDPRSVRLIEDTEVSDIYRNGYWDKINGDALPACLALCVFHAAVNSGPIPACRLVQGIVGAVQDGSIGGETLKAIQAFSTANGIAELIRRYQNGRRSFYKSLTTFPVFGKGWLARTDRVETEALRLIPTGKGAA